MIPRRLILVIGTFLITVLLYVDRACIGAAKENISSDFNLTTLQWTWVLAIFTLGYALFQRPAGIFSDKKGPRVAMSCIIGIWSLLTAVTGFTWNVVSLLAVRFLFGAGEAGAFPTLSKVVYKWFPIKERGLVQGVNFSGSRLGAAFAYPVVFALIISVGWRWSFAVFGVVGIAFALVWWFFFRNTPEEVLNISEDERKYIINNRQQTTSVILKPLTLVRTMKSTNLWMAMIQYVGSNFTFYFTLTWMFPYLKEAMQASGTNTSFYAMAPLIAGAIGNWVSGFLVDKMFQSGRWRWSRRLPAMIGFTLAAVGMALMPQSEDTMVKLVLLSIAIFGADMTLSPSWAFCIDIGKEHAGVVSGTMNMAGNLGAFASILVFGYLAESLVASGLNPKDAMAANDMFFYICAGLSALSILMWSFMRPRYSLVD